MVRARYRQRPDGVFQIVGHGRWRATARTFVTTLAAFALIAALSAAVTVYLVLALPVLASLGAFLLLEHLRHRAAPEPAATPTPLPTRTATLHRLRDARP